VSFASFKSANASLSSGSPPELRASTRTGRSSWGSHECAKKPVHALQREGIGVLVDDRRAANARSPL